MGFLGSIITLIIIGIICRALRARFKAVDWIAYLFILAVFILTWIEDGFWIGLLSGFFSLIIVVLVLGMGGGTEIKRFGYKYMLVCKECGYEKLEILDDTGDMINTRCKRCGYTQEHILNH